DEMFTMETEAALSQQRRRGDTTNFAGSTGGVPGVAVRENFDTRRMPLEAPIFRRQSKSSEH
ncbi:MAG: hypothetical protein KBH45_18675, partial [Verrucomicrobia bacterium]|nr:hypothetical protein [Verrucomicrobiota bacterium]